MAVLGAAAGLGREDPLHLDRRARTRPAGPGGPARPGPSPTRRGATARPANSSAAQQAGARRAGPARRRPMSARWPRRVRGAGRGSTLDRPRRAPARRRCYAWGSADGSAVHRHHGSGRASPGSPRTGHRRDRRWPWAGISRPSRSTRPSSSGRGPSSTRRSSRSRPSTSTYDELLRVIRPLQDEVKGQGLWAAHLPPALGGMGFGQVRLGLLHEILGQSPTRPAGLRQQRPRLGQRRAAGHRDRAVRAGGPARAVAPAAARREAAQRLLHDRARSRRRSDPRSGHPGRSRTATSGSSTATSGSPPTGRWPTSSS